MGFDKEVFDLNKPARKREHRYSEEMIQDCLLTIESGDIEDLFGIIPRIGVLREPRFSEPLLKLLSGGDLKHREFAAYALGAMSKREFMEPLKRAFLESRKMRGFGAEEFQIAVIEAIGAIGDDAAVDFFLPILKGCEPTKGAKISRWIVESLGSIAQQGGVKSLDALVELTYHTEPEIQSLALSEISVAFWHRPNDIDETILARMCELMTAHNSVVAESALAALQSLADVGCQRAEELFPDEN
jgi:HEAT repeat protein